MTELFDALGWPLVAAVVLLPIAVIVVAALRRRRWHHQFERAGPLFTPAERRFLAVLERAVDRRARIYGKVRLADIVRVRAGVRGGRFAKAFGFVACKHVDYVLCEPEAHEILCAIELDDRSHEAPERRERDTLVDGALRAAGIPILRFPVRSRYAVGEVRASLDEVLEG